MYKHGFIVMRAQPFHKGHSSLIDKMLNECLNITIILGSTQESRTERNPFTFEERKFMIENIYKNKKNIKVCGTDDKSDDNIWYKNIINILKNDSFGMPDVYYCGDYINGYFLDKKEFKIIIFDKTKQVGDHNISATKIRNMIKNNDSNWEKFIPKQNINYLKTLINNIKI